MVILYIYFYYITACSVYGFLDISIFYEVYVRNTRLLIRSFDRQLSSGKHLKIFKLNLSPCILFSFVTHNMGTAVSSPFYFRATLGVKEVLQSSKKFDFDFFYDFWFYITPTV